ncbi:MAG: hypothetical protein ACI364_06440 [Coriobacteriales bacterium]
MSYVVPRAYVDNFADSIELISSDAKARLVQILSSLDMERVTEDMLVGIMRTVTLRGTQQAAYLAEKFYMGLRERMVEPDDFEGVTQTASNADIVEQNARDAMSGDMDVTVAKLQRQIGNEVKHSAMATTRANVLADPKRPRCARVPQMTRSYAAGCPFCQTLASRGFVYVSRETASFHAHDDCSCVVVPSWDPDPQVEGYDPAAYNEGYERFKNHDYSQPDRTITHTSIADRQKADEKQNASM